jgi:HAD superfamily hydrolase (TIGR01549 family)
VRKDAPTDVPNDAPPGTDGETRAWLVDLDGTLYRHGPMKRRMALKLLLQSPTSLPLLRRFRKEHEGLRDRPPPDGTSPYDEQVTRTAAATGISAERVRQRVEDWMLERPGRLIRNYRRDDLVDDLITFRSRGGKTAVVSDYPARIKLAALEIADLFDVIVANGEEGGPLRLKPDPSGYLLAAKQLGVEPRHCLVIGDRVDADGAAAESAGMRFRHVH